MATTVPNNAFDTQQPKPAYAGLHNLSSAMEIASAYGQYADSSGGDTEQNRQTAMKYLGGIGVDQARINDAYSIYKRPPPAPKNQYTTLNKTSSAQDIASAYSQYAGGAGGDTDPNRQTAIDYLRGIGIDQSTMDDAYKIYKQQPGAPGANTGPNAAQGPGAAQGPISTTNTQTRSSGLVSGAMQLPPAAAATYAPTTRTVNQPTDTVQGQVNSILANDSPLMQRARTLATQEMAQRGLINSSMAQGAGVAAMIDRATPIAAQDANIYSQVSADNMNALNSAGQFNTGETNKFGLQRNDQSFTGAENAANRSFQTSERLGGEKFAGAENAANRTSQATLQAAQQTFQAAQTSLDRDQQVAITKLTNDLNKANVPQTFAANLALSSANQVAAISADANLTPEAKKVAIQNAIDNTNNTMQWASTFYNTPLPTIAPPGGTATTLNAGGSYAPAPPPAPPPAPAPAPAAQPIANYPVYNPLQQDALGP